MASGGRNMAEKPAAAHTAARLAVEHPSEEPTMSAGQSKSTHQSAPMAIVCS